MTQKTAFPLCWPAGWKRTPGHQQSRAKFGKATQSSYGSWKTRTELSIAQATQRVLDELARMGIRHNIIISTNLQLRGDGLPRSGQRQPLDPGAAVYFTDCNQDRCIAVDRYDRIEDNLAAIAATLDAMRAIERHGGAEILNRAFTGFTALPAPMAAGEHWRSVLEVDESARLPAVEDAYKRLRRATHPDHGGTNDAFVRVQRAWERAQAELAP